MTTATETFTIVADTVKNRIKVYAKSVPPELASKYVGEFVTALDKMKPGFTGMTVILDAALLAPEVQEKLAPTFDMAVKRGLNTDKSWAFVANSQIFKIQMNRLFKGGVTPFQSVEEADAYLDSK